MLRGNPPPPPNIHFFLFLSISFPSLLKKKSENFEGGLNPLNPPPLKYALAYLHDDDVTAFRSPNYVLCNFYEAKFFVYNSHFTSVEQAYQWRKMKHIGQEAYALEISKSKTPGRAKQIANRVPGNLLKDWHVIKCDVMRELLIAKVEQCSKFRTTLLKTEGKRLIEATNDMYWASGLPPYLSTTTKPECFPGKNWLGRILEDIRDELRQSTSSSSMDTSDSTNTCTHRRRISFDH